MINKIFIDTGFVLARINPNDQYRQEAVKLAHRFKNTPAITTEAILLEIGNAMARKYKSQAIEFIEDCLTSDEIEVVKITPHLFNRSLTLYKKYQDKEWGLVDCLSFVVMLEKGVTQALTFDKHFSQAGFQILTVN
ncbi:MAG: type II toxin-antitoxin system VapC family toxin [Tatlockia sp.]|nr:type II toxin-antitoxin system VapC family toxin [Tatlockia sp.]